jgi:hypothetical protein
LGTYGHGGTLDQALGQAEAGAQQELAAGHLAFVNFMVVAGQVEKAVKNQHSKLCGQRVAAGGGLLAGGGDADGQVARRALRSFQPRKLDRREREHIGGLVLAAELAVEAADILVGGEQDGDLAAEANSGLRQGKKAAEGAGGGDAAGAWD